MNMNDFDTFGEKDNASAFPIATPPPTTTARPDEAAALAAYSRHYTGLNPAGFAAFKVGYDEAMKDASSQLSAAQGEAERGAGLITAERKRQLEVEQWSERHDDAHSAGDLRDAAEAYLRELRYRPGRDGPRVGPSAPWPWSQDAWKPTEDPIRQLVKAGALIAAEIDRLQRSAPTEANRGGA